MSVYTDYGQILNWGGRNALIPGPTGPPGCGTSEAESQWVPIGSAPPKPTGGPITRAQYYGGCNALQAGCSTNGVHQVTGDPVDTESGDLTSSYQGFSVPTLANPLSFSLTYDAMEAQVQSTPPGQYAGLFGYGWSDAALAGLTSAGTGKIIVHTGSGAQSEFFPTVTSTPPTCPATTVLASANATFCALPRVTAQLSYYANFGAYVLATTGGLHTQSFTYYGQLGFDGIKQNTNEIAVNSDVKPGSSGCPTASPFVGRTWLDECTTFKAPGRAYEAIGFDGFGLVQGVWEPPATGTKDTLSNEWEISYTSNADIASISSPPNYNGTIRPTTVYTYDSTNTTARFSHDLCSATTPNSASQAPTSCPTASGKSTCPSKTTCYVFNSSTSTSNSCTTNSLVTPQRSKTGQVCEVIDPEGHKTEYMYRGTPTSTSGGTTIVVHTRPSTRYPGTTRYTYVYGELISKDASGAVTSYTYSPTLLLATSITSPMGATTAYTYNADGKVTSMTDPMGNQTQYSYNSLQEQTQVLDPLSLRTPAHGQATTTTYNANGNKCWSAPGVIQAPSCTSPPQDATTYAYNTTNDELVQTVTPVGRKTTYGYDTAGDLTSTTDNAGNKETMSYNGQGKLALTVSPNGNAIGGLAAFDYATTRNYYPDGLLCYEDAGFSTSSCATAPANSTFHQYSSNGQLGVTRDPTGAYSTIAYTADTQVCWTLAGFVFESCTSTRHPSGSVSDTYNATGNVTSQENQTGSTTTYAYSDPSYPNLVTTLTRPGTQTTTSSYNADGNVASQTEPTGTVIHKTYNADNKVCLTTITTTVVTCGVAPASSPYRSYEYNADSELCWAAVDAVASSCTSPPKNAFAYTYNQRGEATKVTQAGTKTVTYGYDNAGALVCLGYPISTHQDCTAAPSGSNTVVDYAYNSAGRMSEMTDWLGNTTTVTYDPSGLVTTERLPTASTAHTDVAVALGYTDQGLLTSESYSFKVATALTTSTQHWKRNPDQLISASQASGAATGAYTYTPSSNRLASSPTASYVYSAAGSRTTITSAGAVTTAAYGPSTQLCWSVSGTVATPKCTAPPLGASRYTATPAGRRTSVASGGAVTSYAYGPFGTLSCVSVPVASGDPCGSAPAPTTLDTTRYSYDALGLRATQTTPGGNAETFIWNPSSTGVPQLLMDGSNAYLYGPTAFGSGSAPIEQISLGSSTPQFLVSDPTGVRTLLSSTGRAQDQKSYTPTGVVTTTIDAAATPFGFHGAYTDATGLLYMVNRYYTPGTGQFLSVDPALPITGQPYAYATDNPVNLSDPSGMGLTFLGACLGNCTAPTTTRVSLRFDPGAGANAVVNIGRGASFGLSTHVANWISPGASCTVPQNSVDQAIGGASTIVATAGTAGAALGGSSVGDAAYGSSVLGPDSVLFGNSTLGETDASGLLNPAGRGAWRLGWSVDARGATAVPGFRLKVPGIPYLWLLHASGF
ncbi:MAG: RHS repeat-associated core domain-containing protein [Acidimicrobiales bacterium]